MELTAASKNWIFQHQRSKIHVELWAKAHFMWISKVYDFMIAYRFCLKTGNVASSWVFNLRPPFRSDVFCPSAFGRVCCYIHDDAVIIVINSVFHKSKETGCRKLRMTHRRSMQWAVASVNVCAQLVEWICGTCAALYCTYCLEDPAGSCRVQSNNPFVVPFISFGAFFG